MKFLLQNNSVSINVARFTVMLKVFLNHFICDVACTPYPIAQKCRPQYLLESSGYSSCNLRDVRPFKRFTMSLMFSDGLYSMWICTWSLLTTPLSILTSSESQICFTSSRHLFWISPSKTLYLYFVTQTMWAVSQDTVWLPIRCSLLTK
jgi:hypothetical protein